MLRFVSLIASSAVAHAFVMTSDLAHRPWWRFVELGFTHILEGADHLAFVACLCMLVRGSALLALVTAFTAGHSISLALSYLGIVQVPTAPVEAVIALSVAFMAREALVASDRDNRRYLVVVAAFGLLHGLGFAAALQDLGIPRADRAVALAGFNSGVELGQLLFVFIVTTVRRFRVPVLYAAGVLGMFWTFERLASL
jgi:hydrogenase/urease accessory protein HupE